MRSDQRARGKIVWLMLGFLAVAGLSLGDRVFYDRGILNTGGVLGLFNGAWWWTGTVWLVLGGLLVYWLRAPWGNGAIALWLLLVAGTVNGMERWLYGGVVDYIYYPVIGVYGNMADILLGVAVVLLVVTSQIGDKR